MSSDLLGLPISFEWQGKTTLVCQRDFHIEALFEDWCVIEAGLLLARLRPHWPEEIYAEQTRLLNAKICGKQFSWEREDVQNAALTEAGRRHLLWLKIKRGQGKGGAAIEREDIDEIAKNPQKWQELLEILWKQDYPDFFGRYQKMKAATVPGEAAAEPPKASPLAPATA